MKKLVFLVADRVCRPAGLATTVAAELPVGDKARGFTTRAALAGKEFGFSLRRRRSAKGPVVLLRFYPKAFTSGLDLGSQCLCRCDCPQFSGRWGRA